MAGNALTILAQLRVSAATALKMTPPIPFRLKLALFASG
jgi:hypothetical protein